MVARRLVGLLRPRTAFVLVGAVVAVPDGLQTIPDLAWGWRFVLLALPWIVMSATGGSQMALVSEILRPARPCSGARR